MYTEHAVNEEEEKEKKTSMVVVEGILFDHKCKKYNLIIKLLCKMQLSNGNVLMVETVHLVRCQLQNDFSKKEKPDIYEFCCCCCC